MNFSSALKCLLNEGALLLVSSSRHVNINPLSLSLHDAGPLLIPHEFPNNANSFLRRIDKSY